MPDEQELEQFVTDHIDRERIKDAILSFEMQQINISLEKAKAVAGE